jgi:hypothetical protein
MQRNRSIRALLVAIAALTLGAVVAGAQQLLLPAKEKGFPQIQFADSLISPNTHCPVTGHRLNIQVRPVYVNGVPIGFC